VTQARKPYAAQLHLRLAGVDYHLVRPLHGNPTDGDFPTFVQATNYYLREGGGSSLHNLALDIHYYLDVDYLCPEDEGQDFEVAALEVIPLPRDFVELHAGRICADPQCLWHD